jgi:hypothetical protein
MRFVTPSINEPYNGGWTEDERRMHFDTMRIYLGVWAPETQARVAYFFYYFLNLSAEFFQSTFSILFLFLDTW